MTNFSWGNPRLGQSGYGYNSPYIPLTGFDSTPVTKAATFGQGQPEGSWFDIGGRSLFDRKNANGTVDQGYGLPALTAAKGIFDSWMAMKSYGLAKQQLAEGKRQFGLNFDAQMKTTNSALEDRQRARVASNPGAYQSVGEYMNKNAIKGG